VFFEYLKEVTGAETIMNDGGFLAYIIVQNQFYISEFYLKENSRKSGKVLRDLMGTAFKIAQENKCEFFGCHVQANSKLFNEVLFIYLKFGFKVVSLEATRIALRLDVKDFPWVDVPQHK
jgi:hypothetical protein